MLNLPPLSQCPLREAVRAHLHANEDQLIARLLPLARLTTEEQQKTVQMAERLVQEIRQHARDTTGIQDLLLEYSLSNQEGIVLMCLAEALLRVPDADTADRLIRDKLLAGNWSSHLGSKESLFLHASAWGLLISGKLVSFNQEGAQQLDSGLLQKTLGRLGEPAIRAAMKQAMRLMGSQFVLGSDITEALKRAQKWEAQGYRYSYDMLGEAARTAQDAEHYWQSYRDAISALGQASAQQGPLVSPGISIKLSALHPRYEFAQYDRVMAELLPRVRELALLAKKMKIGFTIDAEEAHRLELSMDLIERLFMDPALADWEGFGIAVQAYQRRALALLHWLFDLCTRSGKKMMVRLVKGAYWDTEIKLAQLDGHPSYPVFTRKAGTDVSYQACARALLEHRHLVYPQFATHNAYTAAAVLAMAGNSEGFEFQRLHGMGEGLYDYLLSTHNIPCRIYAPVGEHQDLLAYLVRRLLENGANSSFVNNIMDERIPVQRLIEDPVDKLQRCAKKAHPNIRPPELLYGASRKNSRGEVLFAANELQALDRALENWDQTNRYPGPMEPQNDVLLSRNPADRRHILGTIQRTQSAEFETVLRQADEAYRAWSQRPVSDRSRLLRRLADQLETHRAEFYALSIKEAGKTLKDAVAEVREAVDFCRYYAQQAEQLYAEQGERLSALGVALCISPWNFPLAIFLGQVTAALAVGNSVIAKPSELTLLIAARVVELMQDCGFPRHLVQLVSCAGEEVGAHLVPDARIQAVLFTGSNRTARIIARALAQRDGPIIPFIAETGGQNCMLVDSTALPEQVVDDVIASGFQSAGQRCSALRVLYVQEDVADKIITMLSGAMHELRVGNPSRLTTDIGPVIDEQAKNVLERHCQSLEAHADLLYRCRLSSECKEGSFFAPRLYEIDSIKRLTQEVFGPIVHLIRYKASELDRVISDINGTGFGLTFGIHSRIQSQVNKVVGKMSAGNAYVNRNMIGAVVGVQPFGGHGLSGTGPKAGGPWYLTRLTKLKNNRQDTPWHISKTVTPIPATPAAHEKDWRSLTLAEHARLIYALLKPSHKKDENAQQHLLNWLEEICQLPIDAWELVGVTGESNVWSTQARGKLLALIDPTQEDATLSLLPLLSALACGNSVTCVSEPQSPLWPWLEHLAAQLTQEGYSVLECTPVKVRAQSFDQCLQANQYQAVLMHPNDSLLADANKALAEQEGALIPIITDTQEPHLSKRLLLERLVSTNTTAAGGNASLLALSDG